MLLDLREPLPEHAEKLKRKLRTVLKLLTHECVERLPVNVAFTLHVEWSFALFELLLELLRPFLLIPAELHDEASLDERAVTVVIEQAHCERLLVAPDAGTNLLANLDDTSVWQIDLAFQTVHQLGDFMFGDALLILLGFVEQCFQPRDFFISSLFLISEAGERCHQVPTNGWSIILETGIVRDTVVAHTLASVNGAVTPYHH